MLVFHLLFIYFGQKLTPFYLFISYQGTHAVISLQYLLLFSRETTSNRRETGIESGQEESLAKTTNIMLPTY